VIRVEAGLVLCGCGIRRGAAQNARARGAAEILHTISCPNIWSYMLPWFLIVARGMFLCAHHLVCGCCITLSVACFSAAAGHQGGPAGAGRCGPQHGCSGLRGLGAGVFLLYVLLPLCFNKECVSSACPGGVAGPCTCDRLIRLWVAQNARARGSGRGRLQFPVRSFVQRLIFIMYPRFIMY